MFYINPEGFPDNLIRFGFREKYGRFYYSVPAYYYKGRELITLIFSIFREELKLRIDCKDTLNDTFYPCFYVRPSYTHKVLEEIDKVTQEVIQKMLEDKIIIYKKEE